MKEVKCNFKGIADDNKCKLKDSQCLLLISVGQESHEGERFAATINLINKSFKSCIISLYDSIQRYTMALNSGQPPAYFHQASVREGELWLERNKQYYDYLSIPKQVHRWDTWINHREFTEQKNKLLSLIDTDPSYKASFDTTIDKYLERYCKNSIGTTNFDVSRAKKLCFEYVLEECAVLCVWPELNCQFEVYPSVHNDAIEATRKHFVSPHHPNLLQSLSLRFRNAKQLKPQQFTTLKSETEESAD